MAHIKSLDQLIEAVPVAWRTDAVVKRLEGVSPIVFETDHKPITEQIFRALSYFKPSETKVIILGQDPYYQPGKANGLAFGVGYEDTHYRHLKNKDSLNNIMQAVFQQTGTLVDSPTLEPWAKQGVLLLNRILTVGSVPMSHADHGWEDVTQQLLVEATVAKPTALLWGTAAANAAQPLESLGCTVLTSSHPSPWSANISFFKERHFEKTKHLINWGV